MEAPVRTTASEGEEGVTTAADGDGVEAGWPHRRRPWHADAPPHGQPVPACFAPSRREPVRALSRPPRLLRPKGAIPNTRLPCPAIAVAGPRLPRP
jgi:hypothetical protein